MSDWIRSIFRREPEPAEKKTIPAEDLQNEIQSLRLESTEKERRIQQLILEVDRLNGQVETTSASRLAAELEALYLDLAPSIAQLVTQGYLLEEQQKAIRSIDVLSVARRMVKAMERRGLEIFSKVGEREQFDPNRHLPLDSSVSPAPGQPVLVRFVGISYQGKILRKAGVETIEGS